MKNGLYRKYIKRILDVICALLALVVFSWLYGIIAVLVKVKLGGPVIFKQPRPGKDEKIFYLYKFRTMTDERDKEGNLMPDQARLTRFGKMLRSTSLDELPEAWNILKGDMSVVGPRPLLVRDMLFMTPEQRKRHDIKPGLSGLAQVSGRNALQWENKLEKDLEYIEKISFGTDAQIVWRTVKQVFFRKDRNDEEIDLTDDLGDYLLNAGKITEDEYRQKNEDARLIAKE